jgi:hypothetical protein
LAASTTQDGADDFGEAESLHEFAAAVKIPLREHEDDSLDRRARLEGVDSVRQERAATHLGEELVDAHHAFAAAGGNNDGACRMFDVGCQLFFARAFAPSLPRAVRVSFGSFAIVRCSLAAAAAFLILRRDASRCFSVAMSLLLQAPPESVPQMIVA